MWVIRFLVFIFLLGVIDGVYVKNNPPIAPETQFSLWEVTEYREIFKKSTDIPTQDLVAYSYAKWGKDFVLTLEAESGFNHKAISPPNRNWSRDHWLCQLNSFFHLEYINSKEFSDPYNQIDYCLGWYKNYEKRGILHKRFFWYNVRSKVENRFIFWYR